MFIIVLFKKKNRNTDMLRQLKRNVKEILKFFLWRLENWQDNILSGVSEVWKYYPILG